MASLRTTCGSQRYGFRRPCGVPYRRQGSHSGVVLGGSGPCAVAPHPVKSTRVNKPDRDQVEALGRVRGPLDAAGGQGMARIFGTAAVPGNLGAPGVSERRERRSVRFYRSPSF